MIYGMQEHTKTSYSLRSNTTGLLGTFENCSKLNEIYLPEDLKYISPQTFSYCTNLNTIIIPDNVKKIGNYAFCICGNLERGILPSSLSSIGDGAFFGCSKLKDFVIKNKEAFPVSSMSAFSSSATLTVPNGSAKNYRDLGGFWEQFTSIKEEVNINISEANKWGTCVLAFDTELPEEVDAFVSTGMNKDYVVLEKVTMLEANKPYVLYAENGYKGTLTGIVDVSNYQETVTDGLLNGL